MNFFERQFHHLHAIESIDYNIAWVVVKITLKKMPGKNKMLILLKFIEPKRLMIGRAIIILNTMKEERNPVSYTIAHHFLIL